MSGTLGSVRSIVRRTLKRSSTALIPNATRWLQFMASSMRRNWRWWRRCWAGWRARTYTSIQRTIMILNPWRQNLKKLVKEVRDELEMTAYCKTLRKGTANTRKKRGKHIFPTKILPQYLVNVSFLHVFDETSNAGKRGRRNRGRGVSRACRNTQRIIRAFKNDLVNIFYLTTKVFLNLKNIFKPPFR